MVEEKAIITLVDDNAGYTDRKDSNDATYDRTLTMILASRHMSAYVGM